MHQLRPVNQANQKDPPKEAGRNAPVKSLKLPRGSDSATAFPPVGRSVCPRARPSLLLVSTRFLLSSLRSGRVGPPSPSAGLGRVRCFHRGGRPVSGWGRRPEDAGAGESAGWCWAAGLLPSPLSEAVPAASRGGGRDRPLSPGLGVEPPADRPASTGAAPDAAGSGRGFPGTRGGNQARPGWRPAASRAADSPVPVRGLRPPQPRLRALGLSGPAPPGRQ